MVSITDSANIVNASFDLWDEEGTQKNLTYTFLSSINVPAYYGDGSANIDIDAKYDESSYTSLTASQMAMISDLLDTKTGLHYRVTFNDVTDNVSFAEQTYTNSTISGSGDITLGQADLASGVTGINGVEYSENDASDGTNTADKSGVVYTDKAVLQNNLGEFQYGRYVTLHEIGHSLGLLDVANSNLAAKYDNQKYSIMSFNTYFGQTEANPVEGYATNLQLLDIAAIQEEYGSRNYSTRSDDTVYALDQGLGVSSGGVYNGESFLYTIWDGDGEDQIDASGFSKAVQIDLRQGAFSSIGNDQYGSRMVFDGEGFSYNQATVDEDPGNVAIAYHTIIENAKGTDDTVEGDILIGNAWDNKLEGGAGNDKLYGDGVVFNGNAGYHEADTLGSGGSWGPSGIAPDSQDSGSDELYGGSGNDELYGGARDDILVGGTDDDELYGGDGDDIYIYNVGDGDDVIHDDWETDNRITFGAGITQADLTFTDTGSDFVINISGSGSITLSGYNPAAEPSSGSSQTLEFDDASYLNVIRAQANYAYVNGTDDNDIIYGNSADNIIKALAGDDVIYGGAGNDTIYGYPYSPSYEPNNGQDIFYGGIGDDLIYSGGNDDQVHGGEGNDTINDLGGNNLIDAGAGDDDVTISKNANISLNPATYSEINLGSGNDYFEIGLSSNSGHYFSVDGGAGNDTFKSSYGNVTITDTQGSDQYLYYISSYTEVSDSSGVDYLYFSQSLGSSYSYWYQNGNDLRVGTSAANAFVVKDWFSSEDNRIEYIQFSNTDYLSFSDFLDVNSLYGSKYAGDTLNGNAYGNAIYGFAGDDILNGNDGNDKLIGGAGNDTLNGGNGIDTASYENAAAAIAADLSQSSNQVSNDGDGGVDNLIEIENIIGSAFDDAISGDADANVLDGGAGNDTLLGGDGDDTIDGGLGSDTLRGWSGTDTIYGGDGNDFIYGEDDNDILYGDAGNDTIEGGSGDDQIDGGSGDDNLNGGGGHDTIHGGDGDDIIDGVSGNDALYGDAGNDTIYGGSGSEVILGGADNDTIYGGNGNDYIHGEEGVDTLYGDAGRDFLHGEEGADILYGGGADGKDDRFIFEDVKAFTGVDTVKDFAAGEDKIDISDILDGYYTAGVDDLADFVSLTDDGTNTTIAIDQDGGGDSYADVAVVENVIWASIAAFQGDAIL